jgi:hypothetical protein
MARPKARRQGEEPDPSPSLVQQRDIGYVPVEERGGAISVSEGDAGPVGAIAVVASALLKGVDLAGREAKLLARAFGIGR